MFTRGRRFGETQRQEFNFSKEAFSRGELKEGERVFFSFRLMSAEDHARMQDELFRFATKVAMKKKGRKVGSKKMQDAMVQEMSSRRNQTDLGIIKDYLLGLEKYPIPNEDGSGVEFLNWDPKLSDPEKDRILNCMISDDRAEIAEAIRAESELSDEESENLD